MLCSVPSEELCSIAWRCAVLHASLSVSHGHVCVGPSGGPPRACYASVQMRVSSLALNPSLGGLGSSPLAQDEDTHVEALERDTRGVDDHVPLKQNDRSLNLLFCVLFVRCLP